MENTLINEKSQSYGANYLKKYYEKNLIPPEKKEYLTELKNSIGPYMGVAAPDKKTHFLLDAASQIATLGLGFNPLAFFGTAYFEETWQMTKNSSKLKNVRKSYESLLRRELQWPELATTICHSGAEANEIALGYCYRRRVNKNAKNVLAFEGSFHGRMQISLSSTWNKAKREPFEWDNYKTTFAPFPKLDSDNINFPYSEKWTSHWENANLRNFDSSNLVANDVLEKKEIEILNIVQKELIKKTTFAIIIEPMQCEGGDQYATDRFFAGLLSLSKAFNVPVIFDEVQTGYHLGRKFFWHKQFNLKNSQGSNIYPDYLVCAKKAQVGVVVSHCDEKGHEEYSTASFIRGQIHASALCQSKLIIKKIENKWRERLNSLINKYSNYYSTPRGMGLAFAFDIKDQTKVSELIAKRFKFGLLYYPAGSQTLRFRLNSAFSEKDIDYLFDHLELITKEVFEKTTETPLPLPFDPEKKLTKIKDTYNWQLALTNTILKSKSITKEEVNNLFNFANDEELILIDKSNFNDYEEEIKHIQEKVYEPKRRTSIKVFRDIANDSDSICLAIKHKGKLSAISFSGALQKFKEEKGLSDHKYLDNPLAIYTADTTVLPDYTGNDYGRNLKYATLLLAYSEGKRVFVGRNRDQYASKMHAINLSLGAYEYKYMTNDYLDELEYNDVIHYIIDYTKEKKPVPENYNYLENTLSEIQIDKEAISQVVNKICLSNFVGGNFLTNLEYIFSHARSELRHGYCASGQSEAVDKIVKSIWTTNRTSNKFLTFEGHYFGNGSFCSRSISSNEETFFETDILPSPNGSNDHDILKKLEEKIHKEKYLGVFIEPTRQKYMDSIGLDFLNKLREITSKHNTPLVLNETASKLGTFGQATYASNLMEESPDAMMSYLCGQAALVHISKKYFVDKPLMLISTWDGDEHSLAHAVQEYKEFDKNDSEETRKDFNQYLEKIMNSYDFECFKHDRGAGNFIGSLPPIYEKILTNIEGRNLINVSPKLMKKIMNYKM